MASFPSSGHDKCRDSPSVFVSTESGISIGLVHPEWQITTYNKKIFVRISTWGIKSDTIETSHGSLSFSIGPDRMLYSRNIMHYMHCTYALRHAQQLGANTSVASPDSEVAEVTCWAADALDIMTYCTKCTCLKTRVAGDVLFGLPAGLLSDSSNLSFLLPRYSLSSLWTCSNHLSMACMALSPHLTWPVLLMHSFLIESILAFARGAFYSLLFLLPIFSWWWR